MMIIVLTFSSHDADTAQLQLLGEDTPDDVDSGDVFPCHKKTLPVFTGGCHA